MLLRVLALGASNFLFSCLVVEQDNCDRGRRRREMNENKQA
jgi:hypothetical protein